LERDLAKGDVYSFFHDKEDALDLVQETFLRLVQKIDSFRSGHNFEAWLLQIALMRVSPEALAALSEEDKAVLRAKGYDIAKIIRDLQSAKGNIIEIKADGKRIRIWLD